VTFLDLVRSLGELSRDRCHPDCSLGTHRQEAARHLGLLLENPGLLRALAARLSAGSDAAAETDCRLLRKENEQLRDALGMARTEYGGKPISELDEYDRLRLTANGFQAMDGVLRATIARLRADLSRALPVVEAAKALVEHDQAKPALGYSISVWRAERRRLLDALAREVRSNREGGPTYE
jgi:hypothetical protein